MRACPVEAVGGSANADSTRDRRPIASSGAITSARSGSAMVRGREFTAAEEESTDAPRVAIVDELLARQLVPDRDPIGQMIRIVRRGDDADRGNDGEPMEIVGHCAADP